MSMRQSRRRFINLTGAGIAVISAGIGLTLAQSPERTINVVCKKFSFTPDVLRLKLNEPVALVFTTEDVFMGFNAPDLDARIDIVPGQVQTLRFTPQKAGEFLFICDVFCGDGHSSMTGKVIVTA